MTITIIETECTFTQDRKENFYIASECMDFRNGVYKYRAMSEQGYLSEAVGSSVDLLIKDLEAIEEVTFVKYLQKGHEGE